MELQLRSYGNPWSGDEGLLYLCVCYSCVKLFARGSLLQQKGVSFSCRGNDLGHVHKGTKLQSFLLRLLQSGSCLLVRLNGTTLPIRFLVFWLDKACWIIIFNNLANSPPLFHFKGQEIGDKNSSTKFDMKQDGVLLVTSQSTGSVWYLPELNLVCFGCFGFADKGARAGTARGRLMP